MMSLKKILPYLLLNVIVSAVTMLAVILIWNAFHPGVSVSTDLTGLLTNAVQSSQAPLPPLDQKTVEIQSVFMPGEADYEKISLRNNGDQPVDLTDWSIVNSRGEQFTFPSLTLYPGGAVDLYTRSGVNTAVELFWNKTRSCWRSGETAVLRDSAGNQRSVFSIP